MADSALRFTHVWKKFRLGETHDSLGELLAHGVRRLLGRQTSSRRGGTFWALEDVD
ncbi:MAG: hypothetical protein IID43_07210, partial [Planctomycetes bacterium]|nr:hypothetical protein [Planctomycetota bacterium]